MTLCAADGAEGAGWHLKGWFEEDTGRCQRDPKSRVAPLEPEPGASTKHKPMAPNTSAKHLHGPYKHRTC